MKIELKTSLLLIFFRFFTKQPSIDVYSTVYTYKYILAGTNELHNYSLENRFFFSSLSHTPNTTKCLRLWAIKMLLFIANVSVKRVSLCWLLSEKKKCRGIDCPLDWKSTTHRFIDFLTWRAIEQRSTKALSRPDLNFVSLCKSSLLIERFFSLHRPSWFFFSFPSLRHCVCIRRRRVCACRVHTWEGEKKLSEN